MTTVQQVFDMAIHLMDEQNEESGATHTVDTNEYKFRTISILNTAIPALYPYSGNYEPSVDGRPFPEILLASNYRNPDFTQAIGLDDTLSMALLPFYLAAQLLSGENETLAAWFMNQYNATFADLRSRLPGRIEKISMPYGAF